jgi:mono/diheme cytochrome c family protein
MTRARHLTGRLSAAALAAAAATAPAAYALERPESGNAGQNFLLFCAGCHGVDGAGVPGRIPPLRGSFPRLLSVAGGREFLLRVPGVANSALSDAALAAVMNWCVQRFAGEQVAAQHSAYTAAELTAARHEPLLAMRRTRSELLARAGAPESAAADY